MAKHFFFVATVAAALLLVGGTISSSTCSSGEYDGAILDAPTYASVLDVKVFPVAELPVLINTERPATDRSSSS